MVWELDYKESWVLKTQSMGSQSWTWLSDWTELNWSDIILEWMNEVAQFCPTLCNPMDCSLSGSPVHGILQARILDWVGISFSRGSSQPSDPTQVSCITGRFFTVWATRESPTPIINVSNWSENHSLYNAWRRQWHPTPVLFPGKSHGQRSLVGCSSWSC